MCGEVKKMRTNEIEKRFFVHQLFSSQQSKTKQKKHYYR
jgi:hypothetical protein